LRDSPATVGLALTGYREEARVRRAVVVSVVVAVLAVGCATQRAVAPRASVATSSTTAGAPPSSAGTPAAAGLVAVGAAPRFRGSVTVIDAKTRARMRYSWRRGCPVGLVDLRLVTVDHWGFDRRVHRGELVVHRRYAQAVVRVAGRLFASRYPIARMRLVDVYQGDDDRSMAANNTSAFNCRPVAGTRRWSEHAYGGAIDLNPWQNPYVTGRHVSPPAGRPYANRARRAPGMVHEGDATVRAFASIGWGWGGRWRSSKDYQHFSASGR
jgi:hypothetical protein